MFSRGETNLAKMLATMSPVLLDERFVFLSQPRAAYGDYSELDPVASMSEPEGLTLVVPKAKADAAGFSSDSVFKCISLQVHSSLDAIGLTAAFSRQLGEYGISANVIAGFYHDHIFVNETDAEQAVSALQELSKQGGGQ